MIDLFHQHTVQLKWQYESSGFLWSILYADNGLLIGESRDLEVKRVSFFCLNAVSGKILWNDLVLEESWWTGIEAVDGGIVYFYRYAKPELPEHQSIEARDAKTGKLLWENTELSFWFALHDKVYANKNLFEKRVTYCLDAATGFVLGECLDVSKEHAEAYRRKQESAVQYPIPSDMNEQSSELQALLIKRWKERLVNDSVEAQRIRGYDVIGFYTQDAVDHTAPKYSAHIEMFRTGNGQIVYSKVLSEQAIAVTPDLFFAVKNIVYCVDHQTTLLALSLP